MMHCLNKEKSKNSKKIIINQKGLTLVEIIVSLAILGIIAVTFLGIFADMFKGVIRGGNIGTAAFGAQQSVEAGIASNTGTSGTDSIVIRNSSGTTITTVQGKILPGTGTAGGNTVTTSVFVPNY